MPHTCQNTRAQRVIGGHSGDKRRRGDLDSGCYRCHPNKLMTMKSVWVGVCHRVNSGLISISWLVVVADERLAAGDAVNVAARLEQVAAPGGSS